MPASDLNPADYAPGTLIHNHPDWKYHAAPGLSSTAVKTFILKSPLHYYQTHVTHQIERDQSDAMLLGELTHCMVLEPDSVKGRFERELSLEDYPDALVKVDDMKKYLKQHSLSTSGVKSELIKRIQEHDPDVCIWDQRLYRQKQGKKKVISASLWEKACGMTAGVIGNPAALRLLSEGSPEVSVWARHCMNQEDDEGKGCTLETLIKCRCDWLNEYACVDLKTCSCSSPDAFAKDCAKFGYALQAVHYLETLNSAGIDCPMFLFIAVESEPPYLAQVYELDGRSLDKARERYYKALEQLAYCQEINQWPGYTNCFSTLSLPVWHLKQLEVAA